VELKDFVAIPNLEDCRSLLCVQPHPDDNEVGAGASIAKLAAKGCKVTYLTVTNGRMGTLDAAQKTEELVERRRNEAEQSAAFLGVSNSVFLDFNDGEYLDEQSLCREIVAVIRKVKPEIVMTVDPFLPYEVHPDHRRVGMATSEACLFSPFPNFMPDECADSCGTWTVKGIAFHSTAYPNTFMNVDDTWEKKIMAIALHKSQFDADALQRLGCYMDFKARQNAQGKDFARAETFKVLTTNHLHMNVDTINL
jgi:LmbE family N-acetylglucosaminyl deacetylase